MPTGGAAGGAVPTGGAAGGGIGPVTGPSGASWGRLSTASRRLEHDWHFVKPEEPVALDAKSAFAFLQGDDPRPMLLLRDCRHSEKDNAKVGEYLQDERVVLALQWFHCVRVGSDSIDPGHPFASLFEGARNPHMVLLTWDGKERIDVPFMPSANALWGDMRKVLRLDYKRPADRAISDWREILNDFDKIDTELARLKGQAYGQGDKVSASLERKIEEAEARQVKLTTKESKVKDLEFRSPEQAALLEKKRTAEDNWRKKLLGK